MLYIMSCRELRVHEFLDPDPDPDPDSEKAKFSDPDSDSEKAKFSDPDPVGSRPDVFPNVLPPLCT